MTDKTSDIANLNEFLNGHTKEELVAMLMKMSSANTVDLTGCEAGDAIDTTNTYEKISFDGHTLIPEELVAIGYDTTIRCDLSPEAWKRVAASRQVVDNIVERNETVYGINTGFGNFANVVISEDQLRRLQVNLIRSHASGVGEPIEVKSARMLLALRINVLARGHSGIRTESIKTMLLCLNNNCIPWVPARGTVGASGDLAPLSHLALGMMGEGKMYNPRTEKYECAAAVLGEFNITPLELFAKEGLALINGTQLITSIGAEAVVRAKRIARQADVVAALSIEGLCGSTTAFHPLIHSARPHRGQQLVAGRVRSLLGWNEGKSEIAQSHESCTKVQDSYTLRCIPQIHGVAHDAIAWVYDVIFTEMNSATDNPMVFPNASRGDINNWHGDLAKSLELQDRNSQAIMSSIRAGRKPALDSLERPVFTFASNSDIAKVAGAGSDDPTAIPEGVILSGGNFHGEYPAKALDFLAIAVHELASVAERRIERLVNPQLSGLPAFLVPRGGLNSGFMIAHCAAASLVSENKVLCHPSSVDSISTSAAQEDHVSMGGFSARKALQVVANVEYVVAVELLCAAQAIDFHHKSKMSTTEPLEEVFKVVRSKVAFWDEDRYMNPDIEAAQQLLLEEKIWKAVESVVPVKYQNVANIVHSTQ